MGQTKKNINNLTLHETMTVNSDASAKVDVLKVPGGFLYIREDIISNGVNMVFVPDQSSKDVESNQIIIDPIQNAFVITRHSEYSGKKIQYTAPSDIELLMEIQSLCCNPGSRYDEKRVYIIEAPGDKHEKFTDAHAEVIFGEDDEVASE